MISWENLTLVGKANTRVVPSTWSKDKYPEAPELYAGMEVTALDVDGPGVVTNIHVSDYKVRTDPTDRQSASAIVVKVWYDYEESPSIKMPLMDFVGDVEASCDYYDTVFFSHVKLSHNFRLPMPFARHIKIQLENPSNIDLRGYIDIQWDKIERLPESAGYLHACYHSGSFTIPEEKLELCSVSGAGVIVAHWFQISGDDPRCKRGEFLCEGNDEFYLNGEEHPSVEYLGTEDLYGFSYGFHGIQSDGYCAVIRIDDLPSGGSRVAMLRCREEDRISFTDGCKGILTYEYDNIDKTQEVTAEYTSCYYYYQKRR